MASSVEISNRALSILGEARIVSMDDNNKAARAMKARFDILRDAELEAHAWRFAVKRTTLAASVDVPPWGYSYIYDRPTDDLRPLRVGNSNVNSLTLGVQYEASGYVSDGLYEIVEGRIQTNQSAPLNYEYIARITDTGQFSSLFVEALAARLAADAAEEITQSNTKQQAAGLQYKNALSEARRVNALYTPPKRRGLSTWMQARFV